MSSRPDPRVFRVSRQHLPLAHRRGRDAAARRSEAGLDARIVIDSAGTGAYHVGELPDARSRAEALRRGVELTSRARQFRAADFDALRLRGRDGPQEPRDLTSLARRRRAPAQAAPAAQLRSERAQDVDVPDPYYGEGDGFERVLRHLSRRAARGLLAHLRESARGADEPTRSRAALERALGSAVRRARARRRRRHQRGLRARSSPTAARCS